MKKHCLLLLVFFNFIFANTIDKSMSVVENTNTKLSQYQKKIDFVVDKTDEIVNEYKYQSSNLRITKKYNNQLKEIIKSQKNEIEDIDLQLKNIAQTQKNIMPLMEKMIVSLKSLIKLDKPFLLNERNKRVKRLEDTLKRADISIPEKYRIILEAFKIEYDYSKTIETYKDKLDDKTYTFLRIGRVGLYHQSLDSQDYGYYNPQTKSWEKIDNSLAQTEIKKGIKIAQNRQNVEFLTLPFFNKGEIQ
jgi:hypothetical protein